MAYCITHELSNVTENEVCLFASCPPPEFEMTPEWIQSLVPPTDDELLVMYLNSLELEMDFS